MADKPFGIEELNILGSGVPTIASPTNLNIDAGTVAISTDVTIGGQVSSDLIVGNYNVGIGTTIPTDAAVTSNTQILNVGVVTANYLYGDGSNLTNLPAGGGAITQVNLKQFADENNPRTEYGCSNPIEVTNSAGTATIGIGSTSNAYGRRYVQTTEPTVGVCDGDIWYDISGGGGTSVSSIDVQQNDYGPDPYGGSNPISIIFDSNSGVSTIGIGSTSNAYGNRFIGTEAPAAGIGTYGDIWYDISGEGHALANFDITSLPTLP